MLLGCYAKHEAPNAVFVPEARNHSREVDSTEMFRFQKKKLKKKLHSVKLAKNLTTPKAQFTQDAEAGFHTNPLMLLSDVVFHIFHTTFASTSAPCVNGALKLCLLSFFR